MDERIIVQLSNTSKYAIRILLYMAKLKDEETITATELSNTLSISYKFLTKIMTELVNAKFIVSIRGREGGYKFHKDTSDIKISDILKLFNDSIVDKQCILGIGFCQGADKGGEKCALHDKWIDSKILLQKMFKESSIADIAKDGTKI